MELPREYLENMRELLKDEYDDYLSSFNRPVTNSLRVNTSKISVEDFLKICPFELEPIPFIHNGFYFNEEDKPTKHPYYYAGLYYIQEASAMTPAEALPIKENDIVLDVCAAPGGKSSELLNKLNNTGILVSNDLSASRAKTLLKNLELTGNKNYFVTAENALDLPKYFHKCFDAILIDAPCSGEGMFRKDSSLISSWKERGNLYYQAIQKDIVKTCLELLKDDGYILYSTCTFSPLEDEEVIDYLLSLDDRLHVEEIKIKNDNFVSGIEVNNNKELKKAIRLYPHKINGEGHFVCLIKKGNPTSVNKSIDYHEEIINDNKYLVPNHNFNLNKCRILRSGLLIGENGKKEFEPSQSYALSLNEYDNVINFKNDDSRIFKYLKGETINVNDFNLNKGYVLVKVDNYPLGFGKIDSNGLFKNKYPKGWVIQ